MHPHEPHCLFPAAYHRASRTGEWNGFLPNRPWGSDWRLSVLRLWSLRFLLPLRLPKRFMSCPGHRSTGSLRAYPVLEKERRAWSCPVLAPWARGGAGREGTRFPLTHTQPLSFSRSSDHLSNSEGSTGRAF